MTTLRILFAHILARGPKDEDIHGGYWATLAVRPARRIVVLQIADVGENANHVLWLFAAIDDTVNPFPPLFINFACKCMLELRGISTSAIGALHGFKDKVASLAARTR